MSLNKEITLEIVKKYGNSETDTGNTAVQIALLTAEINNLTGHLKIHKKDFHSLRGLYLMIGKRRRLLKYYKKQDQTKYLELIEALSIRK